MTGAVGQGATAAQIRLQLEALGSPEAAAFAMGFFKTGPGQYGEGDLFRGIRVPVLRSLARNTGEVTLTETLELLSSAYHEDRLVALLFMMRRFAKGSGREKETVYDSYLSNTRFINNWDLVDISAPHIVGSHLSERPRTPLYRLAASGSLWERRIAIVSTHCFIRKRDFAETFAIAELLLEDREDLIHKAAGWMLREAGKKDEEALEGFLAEQYRRMPRTMLRYAIERFPEERRQRYLKGEI